MDVADIHGRIKELAHERNMTIYELAKEMHVLPSTLYNMLERGTMPKIETIERICGALNISLCDFFVLDGKINKGGYISEDEIAIIEVYRPLSKTAKQRVLAYAKGILETERAEK